MVWTWFLIYNVSKSASINCLFSPSLLLVTILGLHKKILSSQRELLTEVVTMNFRFPLLNHWVPADTVRSRVSSHSSLFQRPRCAWSCGTIILFSPAANCNSAWRQGSEVKIVYQQTKVTFVLNLRICSLFTVSKIRHQTSLRISSWTPSLPSPPRPRDHSAPGPRACQPR